MFDVPQCPFLNNIEEHCRQGKEEVKEPL